MKIVLSSRELIWGGGEVFLSDVANSFIEMGHDVILRVAVDSELARRNPHIRVIGRLERQRSDLCIFNDFRSLWQSAFVDKCKNRSFVVHGEWQWSPTRARIANRMNTAIHPVSEYVANYGRQMGVAGTQRTLPLGPTFLKSGNREFKSLSNVSTIRIGTIARLDPIKRLSLFCEVITIGNWNGAIVCPEPKTIAEQHEYSKLRASTNVKIIHSENAKQHLEDFDVFLSTSKSESLGLSHLEALQYGVPVFSTALHGPPEFLKGPLKYGVLPSHSAEDIVRQIRKGLISYENDLHGYGQQAQLELEGRGPMACALRLLEDLV